MIPLMICQLYSNDIPIIFNDFHNDFNDSLNDMPIIS